MSALGAELQLVFRSRLAAAALLLLLVLASLAVWAGSQTVAAQQTALARIALAQQQDRAAVAAKFADGGDAGYAAYYTFHATWDEPSPLAFVAIGQRDLQPFSLRIRMLGLHSQLYESEAINPELALPGRFDFAFLLIYLVPLIVIALSHDLVTGEREAGRLALLLSLPAGAAALWRRAALRYGLVLTAALLPLAIALIAHGAPLASALGLVAVVALYTAFWAGLCLLVGARARSSAGSAATLLGCWVFLTLLLPTLANAAITRLIPVAKGVELTLAQRQEVHQGWDLPKDVTFRKFFRNHPEWSDTPPVTGRFHWKWYYAMHQVGDEAVAPQVAEYRRSLERREEWTAHAGWLLPAVATQVLMHRLADTDLSAQLAYQDRISAYHATLRRFYYPYFFLEQRFGPADFAQLPVFQPRARSNSMPPALYGVLAALGIGMLIAGFAQTRRINVMANSGSFD